MSNKIGVNDLCPCGSNKKYKKCYLAKRLDCKDFVTESQNSNSLQYQSMVKEVIETLLKNTGELNQLFVKNQLGEEVVPVRMQLIGIFTIVDVLGSYWYEYLGKTGKHSERFDDFIDKFCFAQENIEYINRKYLGTISSADLRDLRNSIVHFYGLGKNHRYCIILNPSNQVSVEDIDLSIKAFLKMKSDLIFIQSFELKKIVIEGAALMFGFFQNNSTTDQGLQNHIQGIKRISIKLTEEGAKSVSKEMAKDIRTKLLS